MMPFLRFVSVAVLSVGLLSCGGHPYKHLQSIPIRESALALKPKIERELYRCVVDGRFLFKRFHLSGILLFKSFDDGSTRAVFQNELGFAFFDFKWNAQDSFSVSGIMEQLDKPAVIKTLQRDMELVLMKGLSAKDEQHYKLDRDTVSRFPIGEKGAAWYRLQGGRVRLIDYVGKSRITTIDLEGDGAKAALPQAAHIRHHKAHFTIDLKKLSTTDEG